MVFPECSRNLFKVTASRAHWQIKNEVFHFDIAEAPRKLSKVTASRAHWQIKNEVFQF